MNDRRVSEVAEKTKDEMFTVEELNKRMNPKLYVADLSASTDVPTEEYNAQRERLSSPETTEEFIFMLEKIVRATNELDLLKKHVFYGKTFEVDRNADYKPSPTAYRASGMLNSNRMTHIAHGIIGKATESGELCEALLKHIRDGEKFDEVNIVEEIGDGQWYDALLLRVLKVPFIKVWSINIAKLYRRFGEKFSEEKALNRDLNSERKVLEG